MVKVQCPTCKTVLTIQDAGLGQQFRCPNCSTVLFVPNSSGSSAGMPAARAEESKPKTEVKAKPPTKVEKKAPPTQEAGTGEVSAQAGRSSEDNCEAGRSSSRSRQDAGKGKTSAASGPRLAPSNPSKDILEVQARSAGGRHRRRSPLLYVLVSLLAFVVPVAAASTFVALNWYRPDLYGVIEIGSKGTKIICFEIFPDQRHGENFDILRNESTTTDIVKDMEKTGAFNAAGLEDTVTAARTFAKQLREEFRLPPERIYLVGSSGLFSVLRSSKTLKENAQELIKANQEKLSSLLEAAIGRKIEVVDTAEESEFQIKGVVPKRDHNDALCIDIGGGGTRGGYREASGIIKKLEGPGVSKFRGLVKAQAANLAAFPQAAAALAEPELHRPFRQEIERQPGLDQRGKVYLVGGIVWVMANYTHPTTRGSYVPLSARDIEDFAAKARANPNLIQEFEAPAELAPVERAKLEEEIKRMRQFFPPESVVAGSEVLRALSAEFHFARNKELAFYRHGDVAWVLAYVAEKSRPGR